MNEEHWSILLNLSIATQRALLYGLPIFEVHTAFIAAKKCIYLLIRSHRIAGRNQGGHFKRARKIKNEIFLFNIYTAKNAFLNCLHARIYSRFFFSHLIVSLNGFEETKKQS